MTDIAMTRALAAPLPTATCGICGKTVDPARLVGKREDPIWESQWITFSLTPGHIDLTHGCVHGNSLTNVADHFKGTPAAADGWPVMSHLMDGGYTPSQGMSERLTHFGTRPCETGCGRRFKPSIWTPDRHPRWGVKLTMVSDHSGAADWIPTVLGVACPWCDGGHSVHRGDGDYVRMFLDVLASEFPFETLPPPFRFLDIVEKFTGVW